MNRATKLIVVVPLIFLAGCYMKLLGEPKIPSEKDTFIDARDNKTYETVKIGRQTWMAENLNFAAKGSKCYDNNQANCDKYGRLYDWETAMKACPEGWQLPSEDEWGELVGFAGGNEVFIRNNLFYETNADIRMAQYNLARAGMFTHVRGRVSAGKGSYDGSFKEKGKTGSWWTNTEVIIKTASVPYTNVRVWKLGFNGNMYSDNYSGSMFLSVRCISAETAAKTKADSIAAKNATKGTFTDSRNGKKYKTVKIGDQVWMAENLNFNVNGSKCGDEEDGILKDENTEHCNKYGRLYDWNIAKTVCPEGWHLPSDAEWTNLTEQVGALAGKRLKAKDGWESFNFRVGSGTDWFGFAALPGGLGGFRLKSNDAVISGIGRYGYWWSVTEKDANHAWFRSMKHFNDEVSRDNSKKTYPFSVRCVQNALQ